jgi:hypothetical protein
MKRHYLDVFPFRSGIERTCRATRAFDARILISRRAAWLRRRQLC